jgi:DNA excision repair protein ERCC-2
MAGHALVQHRRGDGYESEVALDTTCGALRVRGRADGYELRRGRSGELVQARVEEIKTFRGDFDAIRGNHRALHWAQARSYGWMLCELDGHAAMTVALVYLDLATGDETVLEEHHTRDALREHFEALCARYSAWAASEAGHRARSTTPWRSCSFRTAASAPASANWPRPCTAPAWAGAAS